MTTIATTVSFPTFRTAEIRLHTESSQKRPKCKRPRNRPSKKVRPREVTRGGKRTFRSKRKPSAVRRGRLRRRTIRTPRTRASNATKSRPKNTIRRRLSRRNRGNSNTIDTSYRIERKGRNRYRDRRRPFPRRIPAFLFFLLFSRSAFL
jgi:hypothetical protein